MKTFLVCCAQVFLVSLFYILEAGNLSILLSAILVLLVGLFRPNLSLLCFIILIPYFGMNLFIYGIQANLIWAGAFIRGW